MGKSKGKGSEPLSMKWKLLAGVAATAIVLNITSLVLFSWRVSKQISYRYFDKSVQKNWTVNESEFGLYMFVYNSGVSQRPWSAVEQYICSWIDSYVAYAQGQQLLWGSTCNTACQSALKTRCGTYTKFSSAGYLAMGAMCLGAILALVGVVWLFLFGKGRNFLLFSWGTATMLEVAGEGYWFYTTNLAVRALYMSQQYPYPDLGLAAYLGIASAGCIAVSTVGILVVHYLENKEKTLAIQNELIQKSMAEGGMDPFGMGAPGMGPPGMGPPGMGAPGMGPPGMGPPGMGPPGMGPPGMGPPGMGPPGMGPPGMGPPGMGPPGSPPRGYF